MEQLNQFVKMNPSNSSFSSNRMEILSPLRLALSVVGITKEKYVRFSGIKLPRAILRWFFLLSNAALIVMEVYIGVESVSYGIQVLLVQLHLVISFGSVLLILISLIWKTDAAIELIDFVENVVAERM